MKFDSEWLPLIIGGAIGVAASNWASTKFGDAGRAGIAFLAGIGAASSKDKMWVNGLKGAALGAGIPIADQIVSNFRGQAGYYGPDGKFYAGYFNKAGEWVSMHNAGDGRQLPGYGYMAGNAAPPPGAGALNGQQDLINRLNAIANGADVERRRPDAGNWLDLSADEDGIFTFH